MTVWGRIVAWRARREANAPVRGPSRVAELIENLRERWRANRPPPTVDPTLPATAQVVAVQHPSATLPERPFDLLLLVAVLGLLAIGTIEIYSATAAEGLTKFGDSAYFLERQALFAGLGGIALWAGARMDYRMLRRWVYPLLFGALILLAMALPSPPPLALRIQQRVHGQVADAEVAPGPSRRWCAGSSDRRGSGATPTSSTSASPTSPCSTACCSPSSPW